jgi:UDPglucose 6-dehydrogenase
MRIAMIGTGYVGLVSGVCFSDMGHHVICVDKSAEKIAMLRRAEVPIYEPGLDELVAKNVAAGRLSFTEDLAVALKNVDAVFIAVGTPPHGTHGHADLQYVYAAAEEIGRGLFNYAVIVTKSTVPVTTNREVGKRIQAVNPKADFDVVSNPEFLREGSAIKDFMNPDRVVVGLESDRAREKMAELYKPFSDKGALIYYTGLESAEMIKYAANAFLATKITFINEIAALCEKVGADVQQVAEGMGSDARIGRKFLRAGPGYGGSCFPKDTRALAQTGASYDSPMQIVETVIKVNEERKRAMITKIADLCGGSVSGKTIAVLGVTFKPNTDDMRDSPSLTILPALQKMGAKIVATDPAGRKEGEHLLPGVEWRDDAYAAAKGADVAVVLTEWKQFRDVDLQRLAETMATPRLADLRNIYNAGKAASAGFTYVGVGR